MALLYGDLGGEAPFMGGGGGRVGGPETDEWLTIEAGEEHLVSEGGETVQGVTWQQESTLTIQAGADNALTVEAM